MRYLPLTPAERTAMLAAIGVDDIDALFSDVPERVQYRGSFALPDHQSEIEVETHFADLARQNLSPAEAPCFLGAGAYRHHIPASVDHLIQRGEFLTSYTPYQPEISQGTLQTLYEFQSQVALATAMDVANASMYDGATACAEAVLMARRTTRRGRALLAGGLHPHYRDVAITTGRHLGMAVETAVEMENGGPAGDGGDELHALASAVDEETACVVVQSPDVFGRLHDVSDLAQACHAAGALLVVAVAEFVSLGAVVPPGQMGADIVIGEGQSLGNGLSFGGPYLGLFATRDKYIRQMPGRICGATRDAEGRRSYTLTLSAREQHIRREKATSNICTNSGLCALAFSIHLTLLGETGFRDLALINHARARDVRARLAAIDGIDVPSERFFNEFTVRLPRPAQPVVAAMASDGVLGGVPLSRLFPERPAYDNLLLVAATECTTDADIDALTASLERHL